MVATTAGAIWFSNNSNCVLYFTLNDGKLYALNGQTGDELWSYQTGEGASSSPAVAHGVVYFGSNDNNLYAVNVATGQIVEFYHR